MQAIRYEAYGATPIVVEVDDPACPADGVLVEVRATGVCRSDWHAWQGHDPVPLPWIPGHEFAGVVAAVGSEVRRWAVGDRVTAPFACGCGSCSWCLQGDAQICPDQSQPGFTMPGSFAELVAIPAADFNVVRLPDALDFVAAASLGCRFATAHRAVTVHGRIRADQWLAVHGCGGVGLSAVMIGAAVGARVIAVDLSAAASAKALDLGAELALRADEHTARTIAERTGGGAHVSIDAVGSTPTAIASIESLRPRGRHVQIGLLLGADASPALPMGRVIAKELEIYGSHGMPARDYPGVLDLVASGALRPELLVGDVIGLEDAGAALEAMSEPGAGRGVTVIRLRA